MSSKFNSEEHLRSELEGLRKQVQSQEVRLTLAQSWVQFLMRAYDALLHYGVNYRDLKEIQDTRGIDDAQDMPITKARDIIIDYLKRGDSAIRAAIRRKSFKVH